MSANGAEMQEKAFNEGYAMGYLMGEDDGYAEGVAKHVEHHRCQRCFEAGRDSHLGKGPEGHDHTIYVDGCSTDSERKGA